MGGVLTSCKHSSSGGGANEPDVAELDLTMYSDSKNEKPIDSISYMVGEVVPKFYVQSLNYPNKNQIELDSAGYDDEELDPDEDVTVAYRKQCNNYKITLNNPPQQPGSYDFTLSFSADNGAENDLEFTVKVTKKGTNGETIEGAKPIITKDVENGAGAKSVELKVEASVSEGEITYQWYKDNVKIEGETGSSYTATKTGAYYVKVTANKQTVLSSIANVVIGSSDVTIPTITISAVEPYQIEKDRTLKVPEASDGVLVVNVENGVQPSYQWYMFEETSGSDEVVTDATSQTYTPKRFAGYYCKVVVEGKTYQSSAVNVIEKEIVITRNTNFGETAYIGDELTVEAKTDVPCNLEYQWYKDDETSGNPEPMPGATEEKYSPTEKGHYYCRVKAISVATSATTYKDTDKVDVREQTANDPVRPTVGSITGITDLSEGGTLKLSVTASTSDGGTLSYQWYKGENPISGATKATYEKSGAKPEDSGDYKCRVINTLNGTTADNTSSSVTVLVRHNSTVVGGETSGIVNPSFDFN